MKKASIFIFVLFILYNTLYSQSGINTMMPFEIKKAYRQGTRSISGLPGVNYWQNYAKYQIRAEISTKESQMTGTETIVYYNNSPDTLGKIVIRLYQDMYKKGNPRDFSIDSSDLHDGTKIKQLIINGREIELNDPTFVTRTPTNLIINLFNEIMPSDSIIVKCSFSFHIPEKRQVRMGNYGNSNFFMAYWYPQISVYDDIDGWDLNEYTGIVEFYNDFNDYDVEIKSPANFLIWATGEIQNAIDIYREEINSRIEKAKSSDEIVLICSTEETQRKKVLIKNNGNIWHYSARGIPDFSFATTVDANWEASSLMVDDKSGRRVLISAVYPDSVNSFNQVAKYANQSIRYMSEELPDWPFPYRHMTVFCNDKRSGGMETPMMANNGDSNNQADEDRLTFHEISHTYFPFYMGTNERKYAWMDEGWAAYLVSAYSDIFTPGNTYFNQIVKSFEKFNGKEAEIPPMYLSYQISNYQSYRIHAYVRSTMALAFLRESLGDSLFLKGLHYYMKAWNGKHPLPFDFFNCFSVGSGQQLDWYFIPWYFERSTADLGIKKITSDNQLIISNYGGLPLPVVITCEFNDGSQEVIRRSPAVWSSGDSAISIQLDTNKKIKKITIGSDQIPDVNKSNNVMVF